MSWFLLILAAAAVGLIFSQFLSKPFKPPAPPPSVEPTQDDLFWLCFDMEEF